MFSKLKSDLAASGLSKQLSEAIKRLSTAPRQTIIEYTITNSELLEACTAEYRTMAEKADRSNPSGRHGGDIEGIIQNLDYLQGK